MKKWSLEVAVVILLTTLVVGYFIFKPKPLVERLDDPETMPVWQCPGCPVGVSVVYVDRRNHQKVTYYYDSGQDGAVDTVQVNEFHGVNVLSGYYESRIEIVDDEEEAEEWNSRSRQEKWNDGRKWFWREADEVKPLQNKYEEIRRIYQHLHSSLKLAENQPRPKPSINHKKIELFQRLLTEYRRQDWLAQKVWGRDAEVAAYKTYLAFLIMESAYRDLNKEEQKILFTSHADNLPAGIKLDSGPEVREIAGILLTSKNPRRDFKDFLTLSYMEIDYMSAWSIAEGDQMDKIKEDYYRELREKGLNVED